MSDDLLTPEILAEAYATLETEEVSRTAAEIKSICRAHMPEAMERLIEIAAYSA